MSKKIFQNIEIIGTGDTSNPHFTVGNGSSKLEIIINESDGAINFAYGPGSGAQKVQIGQNTTCQGTSAISMGESAYVDSDGGVGIGSDVVVSGNSAVGLGNSIRAERDNSIVIGPFSSSESTGSHQIAIGYTASAQNWDAIAIGRNTLSSGNGSIVMGHTASGILTNNTTDSFALGWNEDVISHFLAKSANSYLHTTGNFGIGHTSPLSKIHLSGQTRIQGTRADSASDTLQLYSSAGTANVVFEDGGNVGIGTPAPTKTLDVRGDVRLDMTTASTATAGSQSLPANPTTFATVTISGNDYKIPLYGV